jgi:outer membrane protein assembly factor BamD
MMKHANVRSWLRTALALLLVLAAAGACAKKSNIPPGSSSQPDKYLFDTGTEALGKKKWTRAREYFRQLVDNYPQSQYRPDAKLGLGDTYLGENTTESVILAVNEFREFLTFYPTSRRADYAQFKLGMSHFAQMLAPQRDQTQTKEAIKEFETFVERYPNSELMPQVRQKLREAHDRYDDHVYGVGLFYFRAKWYPGAIDRFREILSKDPEYTRRDAVYYYLGECLLKIDRKAEALPLYEKLVTEFERSEYLAKAQLRIKELKG